MGGFLALGSEEPYQGGMKPESANRDFRVHHLIGREGERRNLDAALDRALRFDAPQFVTLVGSDGMGKTRLLGEWLREVEAKGDFRCVRVSAVGAGEGDVRVM